MRRKRVRTITRSLSVEERLRFLLPLFPIDKDRLRDRFDAALEGLDDLGPARVEAFCIGLFRLLQVHNELLRWSARTDLRTRNALTSAMAATSALQRIEQERDRRASIRKQLFEPIRRSDHETLLEQTLSEYVPAGTMARYIERSSTAHSVRPRLREGIRSHAISHRKRQGVTLVRFGDALDYFDHEFLLTPRFAPLFFIIDDKEWDTRHEKELARIRTLDESGSLSPLPTLEEIFPVDGDPRRHLVKRPSLDDHVGIARWSAASAMEEQHEILLDVQAIDQLWPEIDEWIGIGSEATGDLRAIVNTHSREAQVLGEGLSFTRFRSEPLHEDRVQAFRERLFGDRGLPTTSIGNAPTQVTLHTSGAVSGVT